MASRAVANNDSIVLEFSNDGGVYQAALQVRPKARQDGTLVVNTELEISARTTIDGGDGWSNGDVSGAVYEFSPDGLACGGGVGMALADESAHIEVNWSGERFGDSGVRVLDVSLRISKRGVPTWPPIPT